MVCEWVLVVKLQLSPPKLRQSWAMQVYVPPFRLFFISTDWAEISQISQLVPVTEPARLQDSDVFYKLQMWFIHKRFPLKYPPVFHSYRSIRPELWGKCYRVSPFIRSSRSTERNTSIYERARRLIPYQNSVGCGITNIIYIALFFCGQCTQTQWGKLRWC